MKLRYIQIRVTQSQYERIKNKAQAKGFKTISSFVRKSLLEKDLIFERKFDQVYRKIMNFKQKS